MNHECQIIAVELSFLFIIIFGNTGVAWFKYVVSIDCLSVTMSVLYTVVITIYPR